MANGTKSSTKALADDPENLPNLYLGGPALPDTIITVRGVKQYPPGAQYGKVYSPIKLNNEDRWWAMNSAATSRVPQLLAVFALVCIDTL